MAPLLQTLGEGFYADAELMREAIGQRLERRAGPAAAAGDDAVCTPGIGGTAGCAEAAKRAIETIKKQRLVR